MHFLEKEKIISNGWGFFFREGFGGARVNDREMFANDREMGWGDAGSIALWFGKPSLRLRRVVCFFLLLFLSLLRRGV